MITADDLDFHCPDPLPHDWGETGYFNVYVPEANLFCWIYVVHRAGVGATVSHVELIDTWSDSVNDALYIDCTNHNPLPASAREFTLASGLSFRADTLSDYHLAYDRGDVSLQLRFTSLMEPYDIHDPSMDPMAVADAELAVATSGFGSAYASHFDMSVRARGELRVGGRTHEVDCVSTMDHSWGPRPESGFSPMNWSNAHFDEGNVVHGIFAFDRFAPAGEQHTFRHGFALVDGEVRGAKAGSVSAIRNDGYVNAVEMRITDIDDREHVLHGVAVSHTPWRLYGNTQSTMAMMQWRRAGSDTVGYGTYFDTWPLNQVRRGAGETLP